MREETFWRRNAVLLFSVYCLFIWLIGMAFFVYSYQLIGSGSKTPTATQTVKYVQKSKGQSFEEALAQPVYITQEEKRILNLLELGLVLGFPSILVLGLYLHKMNILKFPVAKSLDSEKAN